MTSPADDHADKYSDPRAAISRRGILLGIAVLIFGIAGAALSIWARRTHLERSSEFWGKDVITAYQLAEQVELVIAPEEAGGESTVVQLSGMPGLGHLRHVFLDDRSYLWESVKQESIPRQGESESQMVLQFSDPTAKRFPVTRIIIELDTGWVGEEDGGRQVKFNERFRSAIPAFLRRVANYEPLRAEQRAKKRESLSSGGS